MTPKYLSASQIEAFDADREGCERKAGLRYFFGLKTPPDPSAQLGSRCHKIVEEWLTEGKAPPLEEALTLPDKHFGSYTYYPGQIAAAAIHLFPAPRTEGLEIERHFKFVTGGVHFQGYKDASWRDPSGVPVTSDLKTTKDWRYQKTSEKLADDTQAALYSYEAMQRFGTDAATVRWVTTNTRKHGARLSTYNFTRANVEPVIARIERVGHRVLSLYKEHAAGNLVASELPTQPKTCDAFGGCPYRGTEHCKLTVSDYFTSDFDNASSDNPGDETMTDPSLSFTDFLRSGAPPPPPPVVVAPPPVALVPPPPPVVVAVPPPVTDLSRKFGDAVVADTRGVPVAVPVTTGAGYWLPGQPMNPAQEYLASKGAKLSMLAQAADNPPPAHIAAAFDFGGAVTDNALINAPEGPAYAPACPEQMPPVAAVAPKVVTPRAVKVAPVDAQDDLTAMSRDDLKALALSAGLVDQSSRMGPESLRQKIREHRSLGGVPPAPVAPASLVPMDIDYRASVVVSPEEGLRAALHATPAQPLYDAQVAAAVAAIPALPPPPPPVVVTTPPVVVTTPPVVVVEPVAPPAPVAPAVQQAPDTMALVATALEALAVALRSLSTSDKKAA